MRSNQIWSKILESKSTISRLKINIIYVISVVPLSMLKDVINSGNLIFMPLGWTSEIVLNIKS